MVMYNHHEITSTHTIAFALGTGVDRIRNVRENGEDEEFRSLSEIQQYARIWVEGLWDEFDAERIERAFRLVHIRRGWNAEDVEELIQTQIKPAIRDMQGIDPDHITLFQAADEYDLNYHTLRAWVQRGHLEQVGRLRASAPGGGLVLISRSALEAFLKKPRPMGRPPQSPD